MAGIPLYLLAHTRSGDKGDTSNIAVFAYSPEIYPYLVDQLTVDIVRSAFGSAVTGDIMRYEVPAIEALNFTLTGALGGGVSRNLALDNYGKSLCSRLLAIEIEAPRELARDLPDARIAG